MRGIVAPIFGLLAVASLAFGLLNATIWKPSANVTADTSVGSRYVVTDPGMLSLFDSKATLNVKSGPQDAVSNVKKGDAGQKGKAAPVCAAVGQAKDVTGWLAGQSYTRITGMRDWTHLSTAQSKADKSGGSSANAGDAVAFKDSDMWSSVTCADKSGDIKVAEGPDASKVVVIDFGTALGHGDADVSMHWVRRDLPNFALPFYIAAGVFAVMTALAASLLAMTPKKRRKKEKEPSQVEEVTVAEALTGSIEGLRRGLRSTAPGRHTKHGPEDMGAATDSNGTLAGSGPSIVDPSLHNLVAEAQDSSAGAADDDESGGGESASEDAEDEIIQTSVITPAQLDAYFARLANEGMSADTDTDAVGTDTGDTADSGAGAGTGSDDDSEPNNTEKADSEADSDGKPEAEQKPSADDKAGEAETTGKSTDSDDADASGDSENSDNSDSAKSADSADSADDNATNQTDGADSRKDSATAPAGDDDSADEIDDKSQSHSSSGTKGKDDTVKNDKTDNKAKAKAESDGKDAESGEETKE